jgi:Creatinase/Prolidase N-terminal domain
VTALDEVAWLLNLRGGDVAYNPIFISYVIVTPDTATLYVDSAKVYCCALMIFLRTPLPTCQRNLSHRHVGMWDQVTAGEPCGQHAVCDVW